MIKFFLILCAILPVALSQWKKLDGKAQAISARGNEVWILNGANIYRWCNQTYEWSKQPPINAVRVAASPDGYTWAINHADNIFRMDPEKGQWEQIPGALMQISAISKNRAVGVNRKEEVFLYDTTGWKQLPGRATWVCIGEMDEMWAINKFQDVYQWDHSKKNWNRIPGKAVNIDCHCPQRVVATNAKNEMWVRVHGTWQLLPGAGKRASLGHRNAFMVTNDNDIYVGRFAELGGGTDDDDMHKGKKIVHHHSHSHSHEHRRHGHSHSHEHRGRGRSHENHGRDQIVTIRDREQFIFEVPVIEIVDQSQVEEEFKIVMTRE